MDIAKLQELATSVAQKSGADIILYNGVIERPYDAQFIDECCRTKCRKNVMLFLCSRGGDANAAYRIARCLQDQYEKVTIYVCGICKSAGTLLAIGAHEIVMSEQGEMGPLDVQLGKKDEIWETDSGLTVLKAISALEEKAFDLFESCFLNLKGRSGGRITLRTATDLALKLATGTISPMIAQIDPLHVGEASRAMDIGVEYGKRLALKSKNVLDRTVGTLANGYPSHGFVIDRDEAKTLFVNVRVPNESEMELIQLLGYSVREPSEDSPMLVYLSKPVMEVQNEADHQAELGKGRQTEETGNGGTPQAGLPGNEPATRVTQLAELKR